MIVYGFYGTGKSTVCENHSECYDFDFRYFLFGYRFCDPNTIEFTEIEAEYAQQAKLKEKDNKIVFINHYCPDIIDIAFIQDSYETCLKILSTRNQGNFVPEETEFDTEKQKLKNESNLIILTGNEYISDYYDLIERS